MNAHQVQLEEVVGVMNQEMSAVKELLERLFVPQALATMLLKSDALTSKLLRPPRAVKQPQGIARTLS